MARQQNAATGETSQLAKEPAFTPGPWVTFPVKQRLHVLDAGKPRYDDGLWAILPANDCERLPIATVDHADDAYAPVRESAQHDANLIAAAPELYDAARLACQIFERKNTSTADCDWLGDDEHEAWSALTKAVAKARGEK